MAFKYIFLLLAVVFSACQSGGGAGIKFSNLNWEATLAQAQKEDKMIFLDAYASWCRPCQEMQYATFSDSTVAAFFNEKFINVKFDMEKEEGSILAQKYQVRAYPTLLFLNSKGEVVSRLMGKRKASDFLQNAQRIYKDYTTRQ